MLIHSFSQNRADPLDSARIFARLSTDTDVLVVFKQHSPILSPLPDEKTIAYVRSKVAQVTWPEHLQLLVLGESVDVHCLDGIEVVPTLRCLACDRVLVSSDSHET